MILPSPLFCYILPGYSPARGRRSLWDVFCEAVPWQPLIPPWRECMPGQMPAHLWLTVPLAQVEQSLFVLEELVSLW